MKMSMKVVKLHTPEAKRNKANTLSTRLLTCDKTSTNNTVNIRQLVSGIIAHKFIPEFPQNNKYYVLLTQLWLTALGLSIGILRRGCFT